MGDDYFDVPVTGWAPRDVEFKKQFAWLPTPCKYLGQIEWVWLKSYYFVGTIHYPFSQTSEYVYWSEDQYLINKLASE